MIKTRQSQTIKPQPNQSEQVQVAIRQVQWLCNVAAKGMDTGQESLSTLEAEITKMLDCFRFDNLIVDVQMDYNSYVCSVACAIRIDDPQWPTSDWHLFTFTFVPPH